MASTTGNPVDQSNVELCEANEEERQAMSAAPKGLVTLRSCRGFSTGSRQAAALIPPLCGSLLRIKSAADYLLVHCVGSWCVVRGAALGARENFPNANDCMQGGSGLVLQQKGVKVLASQKPATSEQAGAGNSARDGVGSGCNQPIYAERVFSQHSNKVNIVVYSEALNVCLSGERTANKCPFLLILAGKEMSLVS